MDDMNLSKLRSSAMLAAALVSLATLGAACGVSDQDEGKDATAEVVSEQDGDASPADDDAGSTTTPEDTSSGSVDVSGVELPRTVTYTGLEVTVNEAKVATDEAQGPGVTLTLSVRNTLEVEWKISPLAVGLVDGEGTRYQATGFDDPNDPDEGLGATGEVPVVSEGKIERTAFIPVEGGLDLAEAKLSLTEDGLLPAEVPLAGEVPESVLPLPIEVPSEPGTVGGVLGDPLTLTIQSAELVEESNGWRASEGAHIVVVKYRAAGGSRGAVITSGTVRLVVDGAPNDAIHMVGEQQVDNVGPGEGKDFTALFSLPDDHNEVALLGTSDTAFNNQPPDHPFPITVPPLPES
jgi:hypothetical protein